VRPFELGYTILSSPTALSGACVSPKQNNGGKYWVGHFVNFSVQNARGGFADIVLLCGWQYGV